jgi:hypothetical protein
MPTIVLGVCALLFAGVVVGNWPELVFALALENSPLAWMQTSALVACATAAALRASLDAGRAAFGWTVLALALLAAALDDRFMGHERIQAALVAAGGSWRESRVAMLFPALVATLGVAMLWWLHVHMERRAWRWCIGAVATGVVSLGFDAAFDTAGPQVIEETLEFAAESLMLVGLLSEVRTRATRLR